MNMITRAAATAVAALTLAGLTVAAAPGPQASASCAIITPGRPLQHCGQPAPRPAYDKVALNRYMGDLRVGRTGPLTVRCHIHVRYVKNRRNQRADVTPLQNCGGYPVRADVRCTYTATHAPVRKIWEHGVWRTTEGKTSVASCSFRSGYSHVIGEWAWDYQKANGSIIRNLA